MTIYAQLFLTLLFLSPPNALADAPPPEVRVLLDQVPLTLNPRLTLDAAGQRINALLFRGLTRLDVNLVPQPDLAESWTASHNGQRWVFKLRKGQTDHAGDPITSEKVKTCLEEYRTGKPSSLVFSAFNGWKDTSIKNNELIISLEKPDPYFPKNISLLRYFRTSNGNICADPKNNESLITSGRYRPQHWQTAPENDMELYPIQAGTPILKLIFVRDETTRILKMLRGEGDVVSFIPLAKTRWIQEHHKDKFQVFERTGVMVSYLAFNLKNPALAKREVRQAIAHAIDRESIVRYKMFGFGKVAGSFLIPTLPESHQVPFFFDKIESERLLELAGLKRDAHGIRLRLKYKTTPVREGIETAQMIQDMLRPLGIELTLDVVEPAVFLTSIRKGAFDLHSSRWIGASDGSIFFSTLHSKQKNNRVSYEDAGMDRLLEQSNEELDTSKRLAILTQVQEKMMVDLPYFPLWYWNNSLVIRKELAKNYEARYLSLSGSYESFTEIGTEIGRR